MKTRAKKKKGKRRKQKSRDSCNLFDHNNNVERKGNVLRGSRVRRGWFPTVVSSLTTSVVARDLIARRIIIGGRPRKDQVKIPLFTGLPSLFGRGGLELNSKRTLSRFLPFRSRVERLKYYKPDGKLSREIIKLAKILSRSYFKTCVTSLFFP